MSESTKEIKKYGTLSNVRFMLKQAMEQRPSVIYLGIADAALAAGVAAIELFLPPTILNGLELHRSLNTLLTELLLFTLALMALQYALGFLRMNTLFGRVEVRSYIISKVNRKKGSCSYSLLFQQDFQDLLQKASEATRSNNQAAEYIWQVLSELLFHIIGLLVYMTVLTNIHPLILLVTAVIGLLYNVASIRANKWVSEHGKEEGRVWREIGYLQQTMQNRQMAKDVRIFGMHGWLLGMYEQAVNALRDFMHRREKQYLFADVIVLLLNFLSQGIAYAYLLWITVSGGLTSAQFLLYFSAIGGFTGRISGISERIMTLRRQSVDLDALRTVLDYEEPFKFENGMPLDIKPGGDYTLELRDVTFRYPGTDTEIFSHLNLTIHPGEKLAVVGLNGAGKTTLVKLLCGFYDPDEGAVLLNGVDIRTFNRRDYYQLFTGVFQQFSVLAGDIRMNVSQKREHIDEELVCESLRQAGLLKKVESFPKKLSAKLEKAVYEDAVDLSGGEMQRLMLARLLYNKRPVVILDEPTAALDAIAEKDLYERYHELTQGCTAVYISHRLASTRFCDRVILIDGGKITEEGTHEALLAAGGTYARLFALQSKWYRVSEPQDQAQFPMTSVSYEQEEAVKDEA